MMPNFRRALLQESIMSIVARASDNDSDSSSSPAESPPSKDAPSPSSEDSSSSSPSPPADAPESSPPPPPPASSPPPPSGGSNDSTPAPASSTTSSPPPPASQSPPSPSSKTLSPPPPSGSKSTPSSGSGSSSSSGSHSSSSSSSSSSTPSSDSSDSSSDGMSSELKIVIGVSVAVGVVIIALILICVFCKKKKKKHHQMEYFGQGPSGYYNNQHQQQQQNWQNNDPMGKMSPGMGQMGGMGTGMASGPGWHAQPPPSSGDFSTNYGPALPPPSPSMALGFNKSTFTYDELAAATGGFTQENLLGQGGFGYVHKGLLPNGKEVAVKSLKSGSGQGEREFQAEVDIISRVHHRHLVSLVGYCMAGGQRMLVYEFVPNKTLEFHLHGRDIMDWPTRLRIAMGSAKGLAYLHEDCHPKIIHRDIKSANILLDFNFEAMVADFGLAKLSSDTNTHVSTRVMGTFGYLAPEYASSGKLTEKSDVFSYGIMLLEIITGKRPVDPTSSMEDSLVDWARPLLNQALEEGKYEGLVDIRLETNYNPQEMQRMVACAAASIRHSARKRPKMSQIVRALEGDVSLDDLNEGIRPGQSSVFGGSSSDYDSSQYNADMKKFKEMALTGQSQEYSSEHETSSSKSTSREMQRP